MVRKNANEISEQFAKTRPKFRPGARGGDMFFNEGTKASALRNGFRVICRIRPLLPKDFRPTCPAPETDRQREKRESFSSAVCRKQGSVDRPGHKDKLASRVVQIGQGRPTHEPGEDFAMKRFSTKWVWASLVAALLTVSGAAIGELGPPGDMGEAGQEKGTPDRIRTPGECKEVLGVALEEDGEHTRDRIRDCPEEGPNQNPDPGWGEGEGHTQHNRPE